MQRVFSFSSWHQLCSRHKELVAGGLRQDGAKKDQAVEL